MHKEPRVTSVHNRVNNPISKLYVCRSHSNPEMTLHQKNFQFFAKLYTILSDNHNSEHQQKRNKVPSFVLHSSAPQFHTSVTQPVQKGNKEVKSSFRSGRKKLAEFMQLLFLKKKKQKERTEPTGLTFTFCSKLCLPQYALCCNFSSTVFTFINKPTLLAQDG